MCVEPFKLVFHWGPLIAIAIVKCVALTCLHCVIMWWPPTESVYALINGLIFASWNALLLYHFFSAMFVGPGFVPLGWRPENKEDEKYLQFCQQCQGFKAPRAHHCRKCDRCVLKMDHHCPWINNCLGHRNHANFTLFLFFAVCGCIHASVVLSSSIYRAVYRSWHIAHNKGPYVYLGMNGCLVALFSLGLAVGVILAVGLLFIVQMKGIIKNETGIESWIVAKAKRKDEKPFVYPYNLGRLANLKAVFCRRETYDDDDGIVWPVVDGCGQYTLTVEQLRQKEEKKLRMREYTIIEKYGGAWFPITKGLKVCFSPPCSDEPRIRIAEGDRVQVSRWKKHWLYGERVCDSENKPLPEAEQTRGWFPRRCAVDIINGNSKSHLKIVNKKKKTK